MTTDAGLGGREERRVELLEGRLAQVERARISAVEQLGETQVELEKANERARQAALQTDQLAEGIALISASQPLDALFLGILRVLREVVGFEEAFILVFAEEGSPEVVAATRPDLRALTWTPGRLTDRVFRGETVALFDIGAKREWRAVDPALRAGFVSGLHVPLRTYSPKAMMICLHRERGFFTRERRLLAERFAGLASQALRNAEHAAALEAEVVERSAALDRLQRTQEQLVQAEKMASLGLLVAGIAHEIKNPLNFINNFADLSCELFAEVRGELGEESEALTQRLDELRDNLRRIHTHGLRADGIINAMLMHAREEPGELVAADLNGLVRDHVTLAYQGVRVDDRSFRAELRLDLDEGMPAARLPYGDLARVLVNLVSNACYAVRERQRRGDDDYAPEVRVCTRRCGDLLEVEVFDNGVGIPESVKRHIFDPFFTTKPPGEGTGLGLSMSYDIIVHQIGGEIVLDSTVDDHTRVLIRVPWTPVDGSPDGRADEDPGGAPDMHRDQSLEFRVVDSLNVGVSQGTELTVRIPASTGSEGSEGP